MTQKSVRFAKTKKLDQLLDDSRLRIESEPIDEERLNAQECLDLFVKGDLKGCIELMYLNGLLSDEKMGNSMESWQLMMDCISQLENVSLLGTSIERALKQWFSQEHELQRLVMKQPLNEQLNTMYQFYYSSLRFWKQNMKRYYQHIDAISISCRELVLQTSRRCTTPQEIQQLAQLLDFLIFDVQVDTLKKAVNLSMYTRFCQLDNQLESKFKSNKLETASTDIDAYFRQKIQFRMPKQKQKKAIIPVKSPNITTLSSHTDPKFNSTQSETLQKNPEKGIVQSSFMVPILRQIRRYIPNWSPHLVASIILFAISVILPVARRSVTFNVLWKHSKDKVATALTLLTNVLNTLASL